MFLISLFFALFLREELFPTSVHIVACDMPNLKEKEDKFETVNVSTVSNLLLTSKIAPNSVDGETHK